MKSEIPCPFCGGRVHVRRGDDPLLTLLAHIGLTHPERRALTKNDILERLGSGFRMPV